MTKNKNKKKGNKPSASTSTEAKVEDLTAKMEEASLDAKNDATTATTVEEAKGTEPGSAVEVPEVEVEKMDYSQVVLLIHGTKICDFKILEKTAKVVKTFLAQNPTLIDNLMKVKEFIPFLLKCLKAKSGFPSLQSNAAWIFEAILKTDKPAYLRELKTKTAVTSLLLFLDSSDVDVLEQATLTIGLVAENAELRSQLLTTAISNAMFNSLAKILKRKNPPPTQELYKNVGLITTNMISGGKNSQRRALLAALRGGAVDLSALGVPPAGMVKAALPVISLLLDSNNDDILQAQLSNICSAIVVLDSINPIISSGLATRLPSYLDREGMDHTLMGTAIALGTIASMGPRNLLRFLETLKGTYALKNYWRCVQFDAAPPGRMVGMGVGSDLKGAILEFVHGVGDLIFEGNGPPPANVVSAVIESGFAHGLSKCLTLSNSCVCPDMALNMLGMLTNNLRDTYKSAFVEMNLIPYAAKYLNSTDEGMVASSCQIIATVVDASPERRDEALSLKVLPSLLKILQKYITKIEVIENGMKALKCVLKVTPKPSLETFKDVPKALQNFFATIVITTTDLMVSAMACVLQFIEYGHEGIDIIFGTARLPQKMISFLRSVLEPTKEKGAEFILRICQVGSAQHRSSLLGMGVLEHFKELFKAKLKTTRKSALVCLMIFLNGELTAGEKLAIERLKPAVQAEIDKRIPDTQEQAQAVYKKMIA